MARAPDPATVPVCRMPVIPNRMAHAISDDPSRAWDPLILLIDKDKGWTSFDVIRKMRGLSPLRKMGHAGTLDPMATGLLIILSGKATKLMNHVLGSSKEYTATMRLGERTPSYDAETEVSERLDASGITDAMIEQVVPSFTGDITQTTPAYSAVKVEGERLYRKARRGERVKLPTRDVTIHELEISGRRGVEVDFRVVCSSGTYIRSLAHEMGDMLGVGAHLTSLRRTRVGEFNVESAWTIDRLEQEMKVHEN